MGEYLKEGQCCHTLGSPLPLGTLAETSLFLQKLVGLEERTGAVFVTRDCLL